MSNIFHIISRDAWESARKHGVYSPESLNKEGFIHCSHTDEVLSVANSLYKGVKDLLLLRIVEEKIEAPVKHEPPLEAPMSGLVFPHIYGDLNLDAVDKVFDFSCNLEGKFQLPDGLLD